MLKNTQKRGLLNKMLNTSISGIAAEKFFQPELKRVMGLLNTADDSIRAILTGEKSGSVQAPEDSTPAKKLLKSAQQNYSRREYMAAIVDIGKFHKRMSDVSKIIKTLDLGVDRVHHDFLFQGLNDNQKGSIEQLREHMKASVDKDFFIKEAGILDFLHNVGTNRGRALAAWEKRYPSVVKKLRDGLSSCINQSEALFELTLTHLKEMSAARSGRQPDKYMSGAKAISSAFEKFDNGKNGFRQFYADVVKPFLEKQDQYDAESAPTNVPVNTPAVPVQNPSGIGSQEISTSPAKTSTLPFAQTSPAPSTMLPIPLKNQFNYKSPPVPNMATPTEKSPTQAVNTEPSPPPEMEGASTTEQSTPPEMEGASTTEQSPPPEMEDEFHSDQLAKEMFGGKAAAVHMPFIRTLERFGNESPLVIAGYISKYAKKIQETDPNIAIKLFKIVKELRK